MNLAFVTGARSEYGVMKNVIRECCRKSHFNVFIVATGMHFLHKYGNTIEEIEKDNFAPVINAPCYIEAEQSKEKDFVSLINVLYDTFLRNKIDLIYIVGDRLEAYAAALAAHFLKIKIFHFAGGQITNGAVDNIYRYNISNLSTIHFVTNKFAYERLKKIPIIDQNNVHFVGSTAVDNIKAYLQSPISLTELDLRLTRDSFALMTFHSQTIGDFDVPKAVDLSIKTIIKEGKNILITYPNNDDGADAILEVIQSWEKHPNVIVIPNLGAKYYYAAIDNSLFVIGNSSSGIIEVPYFSKFTINVGQRQSGRNAPQSVLNTESDYNLLVETITHVIHKQIPLPKQECIYGNGDSIKSIVNVINNYM